MNGFDLLAPVYDHLVKLIFGSSIKKATVHYFDLIKDGDKVLIIGGGTGWILDELNDKNIFVKYIDSSKKMLLKAQNRQLPYKIEYLLEYEIILQKEKFDIIITPFFLDLFTTSKGEEIVKNLSGSLKQNGNWLHIDFINTDLWRNKFLLWMMYRFFNIICNIQATELPDYDQIFKNKLTLERRSYFYNGIISSALYSKKGL